MIRPLPHGFANRDLRAACSPNIWASMRIPRTHRCRLTDIGLHHAMLLTHVHTRLLLPGVGQLADPDPPAPSTLRAAAHNYRRALDQLTRDIGLAAA